MVELFLSSRAELLRKVNMDTGRRIALVGAPEDFTGWMDKVLPYDTCMVCEPDDLLDGCLFEIIIYWETGKVRSERIERLIELLSDKGDLWVAVLNGDRCDELIERFKVKTDLVIDLTPTRSLVPVVLSNG